jgi:hypothetical protein
MSAPAVLDVFNSEAFSMRSMLQAVNTIPYVPSRLGDMGLFDMVPINTTVAMIEKFDNTLGLVAAQPRGAPAVQLSKDKRKAYPVAVPHFPIGGTIKPEEVQNIREFGTPAGLQSVESVRDRMLRKARAYLDATLEYGRVGAIKGVIYDSDGSTELLNLFTLFGVSETQVDFVLGTTTTSILSKCMDVQNAMDDALGATNRLGVRALVGKTFWERFISHTDVKDAYKFYQKTERNKDPLTQDMRFAGFEYGGIIWEQYRGKVSGVDFIDPVKARFFPIVAPGLGIYQTAFAPADYIESANDFGLPFYAKAEIMRLGKGLEWEVQTNPISLMTRPEALLEGHTSN